MNFVNKLERKYGRYAIRDLMKYIIVMYIAGALIYSINPNFYEAYLSLNIGKVLNGQVWRLVTFIIYPASLTRPFDIFSFAIEMYLYFMIGRSLENAWGSFRFNLYYLAGILFNIIAAVILYFTIGGIYPLGLEYINQSMFFAFAAIYPNVQFLLFFVLPIKVKYLAYVYGALIGYNVFTYIKGAITTPYVFMRNLYIALVFAVLVALLNFLIFFMLTRKHKMITPTAAKRRMNYRKEVNQSRTITRHKCAICGRTEKDDDTLEFRFCSKCEGNYEYCMDHLFTHTHVKKVVDINERR